MNSDRIKEIQAGTAYPDSVSVHQALLQVWNECAHEMAIQEAKADTLEENAKALAEALHDAEVNLAEGCPIEIVLGEIRKHQASYREGR